jgi:hypothetical protein
MKHYYSILAADIHAARRLLQDTENGLTPFERFLRTSRNVIEKKQDVKATWEKVHESLIALQLEGNIYTLTQEILVEVEQLKDWYWVETGGEDIDFEEPIKYKHKNNSKGEIKAEIRRMNEMVLAKLPSDIVVADFEKLSWDMTTIKLSSAWCDIRIGSSIKIDNQAFIVSTIDANILTIKGILPQNVDYLYWGNRKIRIKKATTAAAIMPSDAILLEENEAGKTIYTQQKIAQLSPISAQHFMDWLPLNEVLRLVGEGKIQWQNANIFLVLDESNQNWQNQKWKTKRGISFKFSQDRKQESFWIQLEEEESAKEEDSDFASLSPLFAFFEDEVEILDDKEQKYTVLKGLEGQFRLQLREQGKNPNPCYPKGKTLRVKFNTHQIRMQQEAVMALKNMPHRAHKPLLQLFQPNRYGNWEIFRPAEIENWYVLRDENRSGAEQQRAFVQKALNTPDFAILEGPPGSGKTTVIIELICQLIASGKRILLCGSTHVAVDNVLEKLAEKDKHKNLTLLQELNIVPIRIGDENRISESVRDWQLEKYQEKHNIAAELLIDVANLVCGTTIGILQHPKIKKREKYTSPIIPEYDYLIIDESSKTTFQEFLVPALYAKRWILVGDVKQLAPFSDREQLVSNIRYLPFADNKTSKTLDEGVQHVLFVLQKITDIFKSGKNNLKIAMIFGAKELNLLQEELQARYEKNANNIPFKYLIINDLDNQGNPINILELLQYQVVFINKAAKKAVLDILPQIFILFDSDSDTSCYAFRHNYLVRHEKLNYHLDDKRLRETAQNKADEIHNHLQNYFTTKSWAAEIAWRIDREHQNRLKSSKSQHYSKSLNDFLPEKIGGNRQDMQNRIRTVANIALPSVLEALIQGINMQQTQKDAESYTLIDGFQADIKDARYTILKYQHRMHPHISAFPRQQFYNNQALQDLASPLPIDQIRQWQYNRYPNRNIWLDAVGNTHHNQNDKEVEALVVELKHFISFANHEAEKGNTQTWSVACLTFYRGQERKIREQLQKLFNTRSPSTFRIPNIEIKLHTVDKFQGHEADIVFLSMVQTYRDGFLDSPNRLNVAITRAKFQLVIIGKHEYFAKKSQSEDLKKLAENAHLFTPKK